MSAPNESNGRPSAPDAGLGVLSNLPHTRPQRSTPRRAAARQATAAADATGKRAAQKTKKAKAASPAQSSQAGAGKAKARAKTPAKASPALRPDQQPRGRSSTRTPLVRTAKSTRADPRMAPKRPAPRVDESVPRQGFESEMDRASGPVQPPGSTELVATAAEIVSELAKAGVSTGERLLKDLLGRLPLS